MHIELYRVPPPQQFLTCGTDVHSDSKRVAATRVAFPCQRAPLTRRRLQKGRVMSTREHSGIAEGEQGHHRHSCGRCRADVFPEAGSPERPSGPCFPERDREFPSIENCGRPQRVFGVRDTILAAASAVLFVGSAASSAWSAIPPPTFFAGAVAPAARTDAAAPASVEAAASSQTVTYRVET